MMNGVPRRRQAFRAFLLIAVSVGSLLLSGCSSGPGGQSGTGGADTQSFADQARAAVEQAVVGGAGDNQLAILREAQRTGELTFDQARQAVLATLDCIEAGGGTTSYFEQRDPSGVVVPIGRAEAKDEESLTRLEPMIDQCSTLESFWVNKLYQLQPSSQEVRDAYRDKQAPVIRKCLEDNGYSTDPDATPQELVTQALQVAFDTDNAVTCLE